MSSLTKSPALYACLAVALVGCRTSPPAKEAGYLQRGEALMQKREYSRAVLEFRNAAAVMPKDPEPHYKMGLAYLKQGDIGAAIRSFERATVLDPKHSAAQLKLAQFMAATADQTVIKEATRRVVGAFGDAPNDPDAIDVLAFADWKLGNPEEAIERLERALERFPAHLQSAVALARMKLSGNDPSGAEDVLKKAAADAQSSSAALALGELYVFTRQIDKGEAAIRRALQLEPHNGAALRALADVQMLQGHIDEAEQTYRTLAALPDKSYKPLHAMFLYQVGKREAALAEFEALLKADPTDREARSRLVTAYIAANRAPDADTVLAGALKRNPKDAEALIQRAALRLQYGKVDAAREDLDNALHFSPGSATAHYLKAQVFRANGLPRNSQQELQQALQLNPTMLKVRLDLAMSLVAANQSQAASAVLDAAPEQQKRQAAWMVGRNWALLGSGNVPAAAAAIERTLELGRSAEAVFQMAILRNAQRKFIEARALLDELLKRNVPNVLVPQLMADTFAQQKEFDKGEAWLNAFVAARPNTAAYQEMLGEWFLRRGKRSEAERALLNAKTIDEKLSGADLLLAQIEMDSGRTDAARQRIARVVSAEPSNIPALLLSARLEDAALDRQRAIACYRAVLRIDGSNIIALNNLAYTLAFDNPDEALKFAEEAGEIAADSAYIQDTLGWAYYRKGLYSMAVRHLKTAVDKESTPPRQFHLAMAYLKSGDRTQGTELLHAVLAKYPNLAKTEQGW